MASIPFKTLRDGTGIPSLGLGTWLMGGDTQRVDSVQADLDVSAIRHAIDIGYTHIDTAELYGSGHAEEIIAQAVKHTPREKLFIATKASHGRHDEKTLPSVIDNSLKRLNADYIDLYYLHRPTFTTPFEETGKILDNAVQSGKIRHVGVCNFSQKNFEALQACMQTKIIANQVHYNLAFREPEASGLLEHAKKKDYFVIAWRPLRLIKRNDPAALLQHDIWEKGVFSILDELSDKYQKTNVQIALSWTMHHSHVCALVKSSKPKNLEEAMGGFFKLDENDYQRLSKEFTPQFAVSDTIPLI